MDQKKAKYKVRKYEEIPVMVRVENQEEWETLLILSKSGFAVVDVYCNWAGPCVSMINVLKRVKMEINDEERLFFASVSSDLIEDFRIFRGQSEPIWILYGSGVPVKLFQGTDSPKLEKMIKKEFAKEIECIEGKAKRKQISLIEELNIRNYAKLEAMRVKDDLESESFNEDKNDPSLLKVLCPYTLLLIQPYLLDTGVTSEIRDRLRRNFKILHERMVPLPQKETRKLFSIPYEIQEKVVDLEINPSSRQDERTSSPIGDGEILSYPTPEELHSATPLISNTPVKNMIHVRFPKELKGENILMLLEITNRKCNAKDNISRADFYIQEEVGPKDYEEAKKLAPHSMHSLYGLNNFVSGVWCPRNIDEKRITMINFFPNFVTGLLKAPSPSSRNYFLVIYKGDYMKNINLKLREMPKQDIYVNRLVMLPREISRRILKKYNFDDEIRDYLENQAYVLSVNLENEDLCRTLQSLNPLLWSEDLNDGRELTALLFEELGIDLNFKLE